MKRARRDADIFIAFNENGIIRSWIVCRFVIEPWVASAFGVPLRVFDGAVGEPYREEPYCSLDYAIDTLTFDLNCDPSDTDKRKLLKDCRRVQGWVEEEAALQQARRAQQAAPAQEAV